MKAFDLVLATSYDEAASALAQDGAMAVAGGTDLVNYLAGKSPCQLSTTPVSLKKILTSTTSRKKAGCLRSEPSPGWKTSPRAKLSRRSMPAG